MSIQLRPSVLTEPVPSQTGGVTGRIEPVHDSSAGSLLSIGSGLQDVGRATTAAALHYQDQVDLAQSQRMRNLYTSDTESELTAPDTGFLSTEGMDANKDRRKQTFDRLREKRKAIEALGQNDAQRANFSEHADRLDAESNLRADLHQEHEVRKYRAGVTKTSADQGIERGVKLHGTDEGDIAVAGAMKDLDTLADLYGWPKDSKLREQLKQDARDELHSGVIDQYIQDPQNAPQAAVYLAQHKDEMSPKVLDKAVKDVRQAMHFGLQERLDSVAWTTANAMTDAGLTLDQQRIALNKKVESGEFTGEQAMKVWQATNSLDSQRHAARERTRSELGQQIEQSFAKNLTLDPQVLLSSDPSLAKQVDDLGMLPQVYESHKKVQMAYVTDRLVHDETFQMVAGRDVKSIKDIEELKGLVQDQMPKGEQASTAEGIKTAKLIKDRIAELDQWEKWIKTRPATPLIGTFQAPLNKPKQSGQTQEEAIKSLSDSIKKMLSR